MAELPKEIKVDIIVVKAVPYQLCPKCNGEGTVMVNTYNGSPTSLTSGPIICDVCKGEKLIPMCLINDGVFPN